MLDVKFNDYTADQINQFLDAVVNAIDEYYNGYLVDLDDDEIDEKVNGLLDFDKIYCNNKSDISIYFNKCYYGSSAIYFRFRYANKLAYFTLLEPIIGNLYDKHYCRKLYDGICKYLIDKEII